jgi:hypothetical protein
MNPREKTEFLEPVWKFGKGQQEIVKLFLR